METGEITATAAAAGRVHRVRSVAVHQLRGIGVARLLFQFRVSILDLFLHGQHLLLLLGNGFREQITFVLEDSQWKAAFLLVPIGQLDRIVLKFLLKFEEFLK